MPENSSYIIYYNISIDQKPPQRISRETHDNKFTVSGLKPNTTYNVEIQTEDGSGQKSRKVFKDFKTKEAGMLRLQLIATLYILLIDDFKEKSIIEFLSLLAEAKCKYKHAKRRCGNL